MTLVPSGASDASRCAAEPRATSTAVPGAIGTDALMPRVRDAREEIGVRERTVERRERHCERPGHARRRRPPVRREDGDAVRLGRLVEGVEEPALTEAAPAPGEPHLLHVEKAVQRDARARAVRARRAHQDAVAHEDPARPTLLRRVEVAVDADHGRLGRETPLHRAHGLAPDHLAVREHRLEPVQADGPWAPHDVHRHRPVRRELHGRLVRDSGKKMRRRRRGRSGDSQSRRSECDDEREAKHGESSVPGPEMPICRFLPFAYTACHARQR